MHQFELADPVEKNIKKLVTLNRGLILVARFAERDDRFR